MAEVEQETFTCVICKDDFRGFGNNPAPLHMEGRCCDECDNLVIQHRFGLIMKRRAEGKPSRLLTDWTDPSQY